MTTESNEAESVPKDVPMAGRPESIAHRRIHYIKTQLWAWLPDYDEPPLKVNSEDFETDRGGMDRRVINAEYSDGSVLEVTIRYTP